MHKTKLSSLLRVGLSLLLIAMFLSVTSPAYASNSNATLDANQIVFAVKMKQFKNLKIEGTNQNGDPALWNTPKQRTSMYFEQTSWWWRDTIILTFTIIGENTPRTCVVDYLNLDGQVTDVVYDPNYSMCSGSSSTVTNLQTAKEYQDLRKFVRSTDAYKIITLTKWAKDPTWCVGKIKEALTTKVGQFNLIWCDGVKDQVKEQLVDVLTDYGLRIIYGN